MESFASLKFWKSNTAKSTPGDTKYIPDTDDDDDSYFELELSLPNYDSEFSKSDSSSKKFDHPKDFELKRNTKPQSPTSILRSASPKLKVFMLGKRRKIKRDEFEGDTDFSRSSTKRNDWSLFTVKFRIEDGSIVPKFSRTNSPGVRSSKSNEECYESSKHFPKYMIQKYFNRIKPLYTKTTKKYSESVKLDPSPARSSVSFPSPVKRKQLRKSKSAFAVIGAPSLANFPVRSDHPQDAIEGAILHCKRSLKSSEGHSSLFRCSSDPSHERSNEASENDLNHEKL